MAQLHAAGLHWKLFRLRCLAQNPEITVAKLHLQPWTQNYYGKGEPAREKRVYYKQVVFQPYMWILFCQKANVSFTAPSLVTFCQHQPEGQRGSHSLPPSKQIRCNDGLIDTQLWPHQTSWIFLWRALSASSGWGPVEYQPRKNHLLYGYVFGLVGSWFNRTQRVLPMPSTEEPSKKFISWKDLQSRLVIFRFSFSHFSSCQPSLNHFKTCLQILGKPLLEEFQIQWPLDGAILKENAGKGCFWGSVLWPPDSTQTSSKELCTSTRLNPGTSHLFGSLQNQDPEVYINSCCQKTSDTPNIQGHDLPSCAPSKAPSTRSDLR